MFDSVLFLSRPELLKLQPDHNAVVISLASPNDPANLEQGWRATLQLEFDDLCESVLGVPVGSIPDAEEGHLVREFLGAIYRLPDTHHAQAIVGFLEAQEGGCSDFVHVIVHCDHGISRSAAVAQFVADRYGVPILNAEAAWQSRVALPDTTRANPRLLRLLMDYAASRPASVFESAWGKQLVENIDRMTVDGECRKSIAKDLS